jgi:hypothetical protein
MRDKLSWEYLAAFLDADGSIYFNKTQSKRHVRLRWYQNENDSWVLVLISTFLDQHNISHSLREIAAKSTGNIHCSVEVFRHESTKRALEHLIPFLVVKFSVAQVALRTLNEVPHNGAFMDQNGKRSNSCKYGHRFTERNTYTSKSGARVCRKCARDRMRIYRARGE